MFKNNFIYLFGCAGSSRLLRLFSNCGEQKLLSGCGVQASHCSGFSCCETQTLKHRLRGSKARGIFLDQGLTPCLLHWQADSLPLSHQKSCYYFLNHLNIVYIFTYLKIVIIFFHNHILSQYIFHLSNSSLSQLETQDFSVLFWIHHNP